MLRIIATALFVDDNKNVTKWRFIFDSNHAWIDWLELGFCFYKWPWGVCIYVQVKQMFQNYFQLGVNIYNKNFITTEFFQLITCVLVQTFAFWPLRNRKPCVNNFKVFMVKSSSSLRKGFYICSLIRNHFFVTNVALGCSCGLTFS